MNDDGQDIGAIKLRLASIVDEVSAEDISFDDALQLYEEAIGLGTQISSLIELDIAENQISEMLESDEEGTRLNQPTDMQDSSQIENDEASEAEDYGEKTQS